MIITHHPMIFSGIKKINNHSFTGRKILTLIQKGIVYYAMHTNYDVLGMADLSADYTKMHDTTVLSVTEERGGSTGLWQSWETSPGNDAERVCTACQRVSEVK